MSQRLAGRRVLVTAAETYMGPAIAGAFREAGADVVTDARQPTRIEEGAATVADAGEIDTLIANLAHPASPALVDEQEDAVWQALFDALVHPLMGMVRAAAAGMKARGGGRIIAVTSAAPMRGVPRASAYCAARGAQNAYLRAAGIELARDGVWVSAIAQNYVENDTYYPPELLANERFLERMKTAVPAGRIAAPEETANLALYLAAEATFMPGQIIPLAGGWTTTL